MKGKTTKKIYSKENLIKSLTVGLLFFSGSFFDRLFRLETNLYVALEAGIKQGLFNFISALIIINLYNYLRIKYRPSLLIIIISSSSFLFNYALQLNSGGSFKESLFMFSLTFTLLYIHETKFDKKILKLLRRFLKYPK